MAARVRLPPYCSSHGGPWSSLQDPNHCDKSEILSLGTVWENVTVIATHSVRVHVNKLSVQQILIS
jgi:hypothetical protein